MNASPVHIAARRVPFVGVPFHAVRGPDGDGRMPTLAQLVAEIPAAHMPLGFAEAGAVCINGEAVPRWAWGLTRPRANASVPVIVTLHAPMQGGGQSGKQTLALVGTIALIAASMWVTGGAGGLLSTSGLFGTSFSIAKIAGSALMLGGALAIAALTRPPTNKLGQSEAEETREPASLEANVLARGETLPHVLGTRKVWPPLLTQPLVEIVGEDEFVEAIYGFAGPHALTNLRFGESPIAEMTDVEVETREGWDADSPLSLVTRQGQTQAPQVELSQHRLNPDNETELADQMTPANSLPEWHRFVARDSPDEIWLALAWPEGLFDADAPDVYESTALRLRIRKKGDVDWINLPEMHVARKKPGIFQLTIKLKWAAGPSLPLPEPGKVGFVFAYKLAPGTTDFVPNTSDWVAHSHFSAGSGNDLYSDATEGTTNVRNVALYKDRAEFFLSGASFPQGVYEVEIKRGWAYRTAWFNENTYKYDNPTYSPYVWDFFYYATNASAKHIVGHVQTNLYQKIIVNRLASVWNEHPLPETTGAVIAVRAKNRRVEQLSVVASGYVPDYNAGTGQWDNWVTTSNPAPHFRDAMVGEMNPDPLPVTLAESLTAWRSHCAAMGYTVDAICQGMSVGDVMRLTASCGYARERHAETWGVAYDRDRSSDTPVQVLGPRNMRGFRFEKALLRRPHGFRVRYFDSAEDYTEQEIIVPAPGYTEETAERLEEITYDGIVDVAKAQARAQFDEAQSRLRSTFYYGEVDGENLICRMGDLVGLTHDVLSETVGFGRIKAVARSSGNVTALTIDDTVPIPAANAGVAIRKLASAAEPDETVITAGIVATGADGNVLTLLTPIADPDNLIAEGCLVHTGVVESVYRRCIVLAIAPKADLSATVVMVDEAPELWA